MHTTTQAPQAPRQRSSSYERVIAALATQTRTPTPAQILAAVDAPANGSDPSVARARRQELAGVAGAYFRRLLPPPGWEFHGAEVALDPDRVELLWRHHDGRMLIDQVHTGPAFVVAATTTLRQAAESLEQTCRVFGDAATGLRLLAVAEPDRSLFLPAGQPAACLPLTNTPYLIRRSN